MKKIILTTSFIALLLVVLLDFIPSICNRYMQSALESIESKINLIEPGLYNKTLPTDQFQLLLENHPEIRLVLGDRIDQWQENVENLSIETALTNVNHNIFARIKKITLLSQVGVIALSVIVLFAFFMHKKERAESNGSTPGIRFGE